MIKTSIFIIFISFFANITLGATYGMLSPKQAAIMGHAVYKNASGKYVFVTDVRETNNPEKYKREYCKKFEDCVFVGEVKEFVRREAREEAGWEPREEHERLEPLVIGSKPLG